jgi:hypothetical protein
MTEFVKRRARQFRQIGAEYGRDLAAALLMAVERGADRGVEHEMAQIVLREINAAAARLRAARLPELLVAAYERACRESCRTELLPVVAQRQLVAQRQRQAMQGAAARAA